MNPIVTSPLFDARAVVKNTSEYSTAVNLNSRGAQGVFSVQITVTGDGTLTLNYQVSNDGVNFMTPTGASAICTAFVKTSGPGGDGKSIFSISPPLALFFRLKATETANAANLSITAIVAIQ